MTNKNLKIKIPQNVAAVSIAANQEESKLKMRMKKKRKINL